MTGGGTQQGQADLGATAQEAVQQAQQQAGKVVDQVRDQVRSRMDEQKDRASQALGGVQAAVGQLSEQLREQDATKPLAQYTDTVADQIGRLATYLNERNMEELVGEVENFARRQPGLFLGAAFTLGLLAARFLKSSSQQAGARGGYGYQGGYDTGRYGYRGYEYSGGMRGQYGGTGMRAGYGSYGTGTYARGYEGPTTARTSSYGSTGQQGYSGTTPRYEGTTLSRETTTEESSTNGPRARTGNTQG